MLTLRRIPDRVRSMSQDSSLLSPRVVLAVVIQSTQPTPISVPGPQLEASPSLRAQYATGPHRQPLAGFIQLPAVPGMAPWIIPSIPIQAPVHALELLQLLASLIPLTRRDQHPVAPMRSLPMARLFPLPV